MSQLKLAAALLSASLAAPVLTGCATTAGSGNPFGQQNGQSAEPAKVAGVKWNDADCKKRLEEQSQAGASAGRAWSAVSGINNECVAVQLVGVKAAQAAQSGTSRPGNYTLPGQQDNRAILKKRAEPAAPAQQAKAQEPASYTPVVYYGKVTAPNCGSEVASGVGTFFTGIGTSVAGRAAGAAAGGIGGVTGNVARTTAQQGVTTAAQNVNRGQLANARTCEADKQLIAADIREAVAGWKSEYSNQYNAAVQNIRVDAAATFDLAKLPIGNLNNAAPTRQMR